MRSSIVSTHPDASLGVGDGDRGSLTVMEQDTPTPVDAEHLRRAEAYLLGVLLATIAPEHLLSAAGISGTHAMRYAEQLDLLERRQAFAALAICLAREDSLAPPQTRALPDLALPRIDNR